jgi:hypothetical protein
MRALFQSACFQSVPEGKHASVTTRMEEFVPKKRNRPPPALPKRKAVRATPSKTAPTLDDDDWLGAGPPVTEGASTKLTCRTDDEVASFTSSTVRHVQPVAMRAAPAPQPKPLTFESLVHKFPPLASKPLTSAEEDDWLASECSHKRDE